MTTIGPYEVLSKLGSGGFATTYRGRHRLLGTEACLKVSNSPVDQGLFLKEARVLWDLHHPSLPTLRDVFPLADGRLVLVMRYVEGDTLDRLAPISPAQATRVLGRLLKALRVLHHRGLVHNDIKPPNILLEPDRHGVVLVDFGICSVKPDSTSQAPGFTPLFTAPEVREGWPPLPESDLYSLGVSLLWSLGADVEKRILPEAAPEALLSLLVQLSRPEPERRPRWDRDDPLEIFERTLLI